MFDFITAIILKAEVVQADKGGLNHHQPANMPATHKQRKLAIVGSRSVGEMTPKCASSMRQMRTR